MKKSKRFRISYFALVVAEGEIRTYQGIRLKMRQDPIFAHVAARLSR